MRVFRFQISIETPADARRRNSYTKTFCEKEMLTRSSSMAINNFSNHVVNTTYTVSTKRLAKE